MDSGDQSSDPQWYLREGKGTIYGPYSAGHIRAWITENRIPEGYVLSVDREQWLSVDEALNVS